MEWVKRANIEAGRAPGVPPEVAERLKALERENRELRQPIKGLYKAELIHRRSWKFFEAVELATLTWVDWFNNRRILEPIGNMPPAEAEKRFYAALEDQPMAA